MNNLYLIIIVSLILMSCEPKIGNVSNQNGYSVSEYNEAGALIFSQHFAFDSLASGPKINYYDRGKIHKWAWYQHGDKYPTIIITYDMDNNFFSFKGTPYLSADSVDSSHINIKLVNPPFLNLDISLLEIENGTLINSKKCLLNKTDSISTLNISRIEKKNHSYYLKTVFIDSYGMARDSINVVLEK